MYRERGREREREGWSPIFSLSEALNYLMNAFRV